MPVRDNRHRRKTSFRRVRDRYFRSLFVATGKHHAIVTLLGDTKEGYGASGRWTQ